jgi:hypothetical protein
LQEVGTYLDYELVPFIEGHIPTLVEGIADNFTERCAEIIKTHYKEWREGKIDDIASIPERTMEDIKAWTKSDDARKLVNNSVLTWLTLVSAKLSQEIEEFIGQKYGIPLGEMELSGSMSVKNIDVSLDTIKLRLMKTLISALSVTTYAVILSVFVAVITFMSSLSIPFIGPLIPFIPIVGRIASQHIDLDSIYHTIQSWKESPPKILRRAFLADMFLNKVIKKQKPALHDAIRDAITNDQATIQQLVEQVRVSLREEIETKAEEARWLVTRGG